MPVTITIPDDLCDALVERRGQTHANVQDEEIFERLEDLIEHGFHYGPVEYPNPKHGANDCICLSDHALFPACPVHGSLARSRL